jgi:hypothetical protein
MSTSKHPAQPGVRIVGDLAAEMARDRSVRIELTEEQVRAVMEQVTKLGTDSPAEMEFFMRDRRIEGAEKVFCFFPPDLA